MTVSHEFLNRIFNKVLDAPMDERVPLNKEHAGYAATVQAIRTIIECGIDKPSGFQLLFIPGPVIERMKGETRERYELRIDEWWREKRRIPGEDYQPIAFKKYHLFDFNQFSHEQKAKAV